MQCIYFYQDTLICYIYWIKVLRTKEIQFFSSSAAFILDLSSYEFFHPLVSKYFHLTAWQPKPENYLCVCLLLFNLFMLTF